MSTIKAQRQAWRSAAAKYKTSLPNICSVVSLSNEQVGFGLWPIVVISSEYKIQTSGANPPDHLANSFETLEEAEDYLFELYYSGYSPTDFCDVPGEVA